MNLVEAVQQRRLVYWQDRGFIRTVEPHLYALLPGMRLALIAFQVAGGPAGEDQSGWKVVNVTDGLNVELSGTFKSRPVPPHLMARVRHVLASSSAGDFTGFDSRFHLDSS